ncbi:MAG: alpha/beta hydrolase [Deltaproteobacteria bacterium]|nr:alpha/beta hydrolase [Deltaproteobacteria bacterium]MBI2532841.1 alpha/beta hydrolase [Deltaproteobacteria bacterium]
MPIAKVRGINMNYKILGDRGPWVALSPGGRRDISGIELLATCVAERGHRVVVFDRRNCGASDVVIDGDDSEYEIWADDIHELLRQLGALPAIVGGSSSGCRTALLFALRHPDAVRALLLWRVTGGRFACERLAQEYYGQYMTAAKEGGMAAVCEMEHWKERIAARPENRAALMKMAPERFIAVMAHWRDYFLKGADLPVIGATEEELKSIRVPACIVPGNDNTHGRQTGETLGRLLQNSEVHVLFPKHYDEALSPREEWDEKAGEMAALFADFIKRAAES